MYSTLLACKGDGTLVGSFDLEPHVLPVFYEYKEAISEDRTVNIIIKAKENRLEALFPEHPEFLSVPRNLCPIVPREWLLRGYVFHTKK
jgi:hypothetical protein